MLPLLTRLQSTRNGTFILFASCLSLHLFFLSSRWTRESLLKSLQVRSFLFATLQSAYFDHRYSKICRILYQPLYLHHPLLRVPLPPHPPPSGNLNRSQSLIMPNVPALLPTPIALAIPSNNNASTLPSYSRSPSSTPLTIHKLHPTSRQYSTDSLTTISMRVQNHVKTVK